MHPACILRGSRAVVLMKTYTSRGTAKRITESVVEQAADLLAAHGSPDELVVRDSEL